MGTRLAIIPRIVFDTNTVISALLFPNGQLAWLRAHWQSGQCIPLVSQATAAELIRVLAYPKFRLSSEDRHELLANYLPFCEIVEEIAASLLLCRDQHDQKFLDLAESGKADLLISGDADLLSLADHASLVIETPVAYKARISQS